MAQRARRQHVVSQFYLKGFADDAGRIKRLELPGTPQTLLMITDATVVKDFYTVELPDGTQSDMFERFFNRFEAEAASAVRDIETGVWPLGHEARHALSAWIALQYLRGEEIRDSQRALGEFMIRLIVGASGKEALRALIEGRESRNVTDDELEWEWADLTQPGGPRLVGDAKEHLQFLMEILPVLTQHLNDWHWNLFRFKRRVLATSDHPVALVAAANHPSWRGLGIANAEIFLIPLTRRLGLAIQSPAKLAHLVRRPIVDFAHDGTTKLALAINHEVARSARRYVYLHPEDDIFVSPLSLPERRLGGWTNSNADDFICENGLFSETFDARSSNWSESLPPYGGGVMTINDLPWPIPGRLRSYSRYNVGAGDDQT